MSRFVKPDVLSLCQSLLSLTEFEFTDKQNQLDPNKVDIEFSASRELLSLKAGSLLGVDGDVDNKTWTSTFTSFLSIYRELSLLMATVYIFTSFYCNCLHKNIWVESLVVVLTLMSGLAITGENLLAFRLITVPQHAEVAFNGSVSNSSGHYQKNLVSENFRVNDILQKVFHYTSIGVAGLFFIEIVLKVCSLHKTFFTDPWQIFDAVVVLAALTLELVFHFVLLNQEALHSLTYIVLLRLWRIPMLCNIRAYATPVTIDYDSEMYKSGKVKADERCKILENTLFQQAETIRKLEKSLQTFSDNEKQTDASMNKDHIQRNGHITTKKKEVDGNFGAFSDSSFSVKPENSAYSSFSNISHQQKKEILVDEMETQFMALSEIRNQKTFSDLNKKASESASDDRITKNCEEVFEDGKKKGINSNYSAVTLSNSNSKCKTNSENLSNTKCNISLTSSHQNHVRLRGRKRRSSTSEVLDYASLSFPNLELEIFDDTKKSSYHKLASEKDTTLTKDYNDDKYREISNINDKIVITRSDSVADVLSTSSDETKGSFMRTRTRRFLSCPEYVFTQRMSLTTDESMLIEDGHATADPSMYNNLGFDCDNSFLQVMAEYDGTKTYRNEDGIPMTSL